MVGIMTESTFGLGGSEGAKVLVGRACLGLVALDVGVPHDVILNGASVVVELGHDEHRVALDILRHLVGIGEVGIGRHDGFDDADNGHVVGDDIHLVGTDGGSQGPAYG